MSADVISDPLLIPAPETQPLSAVILIAHTEVESAACDCCGLTEECTPTYIERIRERYHGKWICGLCAEAIKDEIIRMGRLVGTEEAMARHASFCMKFKSPEEPTQDPAIHLISAMRQLLRRTLESRSAPSSPTRTDAGAAGPALARSESCFPSLAGGALGTNKGGEWAQLAHT